MARGMEPIASVASVKYQAWLLTSAKADGLWHEKLTGPAGQLLEQ